MGVLTVATPLGWEDALEHLKYVREHGVLQFLENYRKCKDFERDGLLYGDELEYGILKLDPETKTVSLSLRGKDVMDILISREPKDVNAAQMCHWVPEYGSWMVEATPQVPYDGYATGLRAIETSMRLRRARLAAALDPNEIAPTIVTFPLLGVGEFAGPGLAPMGPISMSRFVPDEVINPHPRFGTLTTNIRKRRGRNVKIMVPLFKDEATDMTPEEGADGTPGIYMDAMAFGMGCTCLQVTFQCKDVDESRHLYDQLAVMAPIMLALTAATPIHKGKLGDWDTRWFIIEQSVDCRTPAESGEADPPGTDEASLYSDEMAGGGRRRITKSRYSGIDCFICNHKGGTDPHSCTKLYNDSDTPYDEPAHAKLIESGLDVLMAKHVAHLFVRDPLVIFKEHIEIDDGSRTDHFENIQSTNWNSVRWKPPPPRSAGDPHIGWRTEFRPMEVQLTDFENAAFTVFTVLLSRVLLSFDLNLYIPISKCDENMKIAHEREAVTNAKFWFRLHMAMPNIDECAHPDNGHCSIHDDPNRCELMSIAEIMLGKGSYFPGLIPLITAYIDTVGLDGDDRDKIMNYLEFIEKRATGELMTPASYIRKFVTTHPDYKKDSIVSQSIAYDLVVRCNEIGMGEFRCSDLHGTHHIKPIRTIEPYSIPLSRVQTSGKENTFKLLQRYAERGRLKQERKEYQKKLDEARAVVAKCEAKVAEIDDILLTEGLEGYERKRVDSATMLLVPSPLTPQDGAGGDGSEPISPKVGRRSWNSSVTGDSPK